MDLDSFTHSIYNIQIQAAMNCNLQEEQIRRQLGRLNIHFDIDTVAQIHSYLDKYIGSLCDSNPLLHIFAAAAIISETRKIPTIDNKSMTTNGIKVEAIMKNLGKGISKENYLKTIKEHIDKMGSHDSAVSEKIGRLHISLRIYKKYKEIFGELSSHIRESADLLANYSAFFWLIFILAKSEARGEAGQTSKSTAILFIVLEQAFSTFVSDLDQAEIVQAIKLRFTSFSTTPADEKAVLKSQVMQQIQQSMTQRGLPLDLLKIENVRREPKVLARLVDDLSTLCSRVYLSDHMHNSIDEMSYLELTKDLTPQCMPKTSRPQISTKINFEQDEDSDMELPKTVKKLVSFQELEIEGKPQVTVSTKLFVEQPQDQMEGSPVEDTPVSTNMLAEQYMKAIYNSSTNHEQSIKCLLVELGMSSQGFLAGLEDKVKDCISQESPNINLKQQEANKVMKVFMQYTVQISKSETSSQYLRAHNGFLSILCSAHYLYDVSEKFRIFKLRKYCTSYGLEITECATAIYFIGESCKVPPVIRNKLKQIEIEIYISELWKDRSGYQLLVNQDHPKSQMLMGRLNFHIQERLKVICKELKLDLFLIKKIEPLISYIITEKKELLKCNKIDQIIICSITASLNLNLPQHSHVIEDIFSLYNNVQFSSNQISEGLYQEDRKMNLFTFYDTVFVKQLNDYMRDIDNACRINFLLTPRKEEHVKSLRNDGMGIPLFPQHSLTNNDSPSFFSSSKAPKKFHNMRKGILSHLGHPRKSKEDEQEVPESPMESPRFGTGSLDADTPHK